MRGYGPFSTGVHLDSDTGTYIFACHICNFQFTVAIDDHIWLKTMSATITEDYICNIDWILYLQHRLKTIPTMLTEDYILATLQTEDYTCSIVWKIYLQCWLNPIPAALTEDYTWIFIMGWQCWAALESFTEVYPFFFTHIYIDTKLDLQNVVFTFIVWK